MLMKAIWASSEPNRGYATKYGGRGWRRTLRNTARLAMDATWSAAPALQSPSGPQHYRLDRAEI